MQNVVVKLPGEVDGKTLVDCILAASKSLGGQYWPEVEHTTGYKPGAVKQYEAESMITVHHPVQSIYNFGGHTTDAFAFQNLRLDRTYREITVRIGWVGSKVNLERGFGILLEKLYAQLSSQAAKA